MSEMNVISVVKYKIKDGFENEFVEALNGYDYSKSVVAKAMSIGDDEYVSISENDSIDAIGDDEVTGLEWLDNVTHMLEYFGESRTQSYFGLVIMDTNKKTHLFHEAKIALWSVSPVKANKHSVSRLFQSNNWKLRNIYYGHS